ncbi:MAG: PaaI family thioesterase [Limisphaerales bacterium]
MKFDANNDGSVTGSFTGNQAMEGFQGLLHGGIIASLLDGAMTNCLFAHGPVAVTAELKVRYRKPVVIGCEILVRAWMERCHPPLYLMRAELNQECCVKATAVAKFINYHE